MRNNAYAIGIAKTYTDDCIGKDGPVLQLINIDVDIAKQGEQAWQEWCSTCDLNGSQHFVDMLHMSLRQLWSCGEFLLQQVSSEPKNGVSLRLLPIAAERLYSPSMATDVADSESYGVKTNKDGRVEAYYILDNHPGDTYYAGTGKWINDKNIIHLFVKDEPGQLRGVPWLAPVLDTFGHLRDYVYNTLIAAQMAASFSAVLQSNHPRLTPTPEGEEQTIWHMEPGSTPQLPAGWSLSQLKAEQPTTTFVEFKQEMLKELGRAVSMPYIRIGCDAGGSSYSAARLDMQAYWRAIEHTQGWLIRSLLEPLRTSVFREIVLSGNAPEQLLTAKANWIYQPIPQIDPLKEANAQKIRLLNGTSSLAKECRQQGEDWQDIVTQQSEVEAYKQELGLLGGNSETGGLK